MIRTNNDLANYSPVPDPHPAQPNTNQSCRLVNGRGLTRLYNAVLSHDPAKVERRLETGADVNFRATSRAKYPGRMPLYEAVTINNSRMVKVFLDHGADPDIPDTKDPYYRHHTPKHSPR